MRKYLLPKEGSFYKANLHCHTTYSDGRRTPEEVKELYKKKGYSVVAFTDHDILIPHKELTDTSFLALNGFEMYFNEEGDTHIRNRKCCHICFIGLEEDNDIQPCWHRTKYLFANAVNYRDKVQYDPGLPDFERYYSSECINAAIKQGREKGFFVTYNHPSWSQETYPEYIAYEGMHAMEMMNGMSLSEGYEDYNPRVYDNLLKSGKRLFCIGADDNHNVYPDDSRYSDSGWAFTMIKAEDLNYRTITKALENGSFYASEGPEIYELYVEDNRVHVTCSDADMIICKYGTRTAKRVICEHGDSLTEASFEIAPELGYFRIVVIDKYGKHACTNAYYPEEMV